MTMKAGNYWVGDLCYVFDDKEWKEVCKLIIDGNSCLEGEFNLPDGRRFAIFNTAYGDGEYYDQDKHSYSVDAGSIGCVRVEDITANKYPDLSELGRIVTFDEDFKVSEDHGLIEIGHLLIETNENSWDDREDSEVFDDWENQ
jgi:hypothetical protein